MCTTAFGTIGGAAGEDDERVLRWLRSAADGDASRGGRGVGFETRLRLSEQTLLARSSASESARSAPRGTPGSHGPA